MDATSEALRSVRMTGAIFPECRVHGAVEFSVTDGAAGRPGGGAGRRAAHHLSPCEGGTQ